MLIQPITARRRYSNDAPELFYRKLGDLAFLVQYYELAYTCYHTAKRDFNSEHVWFYFAGALVSPTPWPSAVWALVRTQSPGPSSSKPP